MIFIWAWKVLPATALTIMMYIFRENGPHFWTKTIIALGFAKHVVAKQIIVNSQIDMLVMKYNMTKIALSQMFIVRSWLHILATKIVSSDTCIHFHASIMIYTQCVIMHCSDLLVMNEWFGPYSSISIRCSLKLDFPP